MAYRRLAILGIVLVLASPAVLAHKLKLFAQTEGNWIRGRVYFVGGSAAAGTHIEVRDAEGRLLAELTPDTEGRFGYRMQSATTEYQLIASTGDGHRVAQRLTPNPLLADPAQTHAMDPSETASGANPLDPASLMLIEQTLARQTQPLAERLNALEDRILLQDILGGIGYILGLTGFALWWRCRRPQS